MRDRRVREQALHVGLQRGADAADREREHGEHPHRGAPVGAIERERDQEHAEERREPGRLRRGRHEARDRSGRALVHVGRPGMERHRRDLEAEADEQQREPGHQRARSRTGCCCARNCEIPVSEVVPVAPYDERDPVQEDRRRERAEHEVLDAGFLRAQPAAVECGEHVQRNRQHLEREEHDDQVVRGGHDDHAEAGEEHQREVLGRFELLATQVGDGHQQRERGRDDDEDPEVHAEAVDAHHARHRADRTVVTDVDPLPGERSAGCEHAGRRERRTQRSWRPGVAG